MERLERQGSWQPEQKERPEGRRRRRRRRTGRSQMRCHRCQQPGHFARECRAPAPVGSTGSVVRREAELGGKGVPALADTGVVSTVRQELGVDPGSSSSTVRPPTLPDGPLAPAPAVLPPERTGRVINTVPPVASVGRHRTPQLPEVNRHVPPQPILPSQRQTLQIVDEVSPVVSRGWSVWRGRAAGSLGRRSDRRAAERGGGGGQDAARCGATVASNRAISPRIGSTGSVVKREAELGGKGVPALADTGAVSTVRQELGVDPGSPSSTVRPPTLPDGPLAPAPAVLHPERTGRVINTVPPVASEGRHRTPQLPEVNRHVPPQPILPSQRQTLQIVDEVSPVVSRCRRRSMQWPLGGQYELLDSQAVVLSKEQTSVIGRVLANQLARRAEQARSSDQERVDCGDRAMTQLLDELGCS
ncbi:hypothetical protein EGW08_019712 [Elysia chlorotica]|uniref:CCHC-type domain-containing protein n=1 Tax=Elysia chlorotica TaxID=188477 RepID=A0A3S1AUI6_ELYCH|nr:hypothetical protein EGW08_019712 [Elysia chlorotica]